MKKIFFVFLIFLISGCHFKELIPGNNISDVFLASSSSSVKLYDFSFKEEISLSRGTKVKTNNKKYTSEDIKYIEVVYNKKTYLVNENNIVEDIKSVVLEQEMFVRTPVTPTASNKVLGLLKKGEKIEVLGFDKVDTNGIVNKYKILYNGKEAYVYGKYFVNSKEESLLNYDAEKTFLIHSKRKNTLGGGSASNLDFFPRDKGNFENNVMPKEVRALYINASAVRKIDEYIKLAKETNINAFVIDIKDNTMPGYKSNVMKEYSKTSYERAISSLENYQSYIKKAKDAGFYVVGRITVFKDSYFVKDHPEVAILNTETNTALLHNGSNWPSAYNRLVWEYNVNLAKEAVEVMGFNEIQFDYVRFPDRTKGLEDAGKINMKNTYNEDKAAAIQRFLMYAADELHSVNAYISADVFGESAHPYVTGYGQYFGAISNVVDVISPMPYPDHFGAHEYDFKEVVWTVPYEVLKFWGEYVVRRQSEIPTPAVVRSWFQAYDAVRKPYIKYDAAMADQQLKAFYEMGLNGGYMPWSASSSLERYASYKEIFKKDYLGEQ